MAKDTKFRADVAEQIGLGCTFPKVETLEIVPDTPNVLNPQEKEEVVTV